MGFGGGRPLIGELRRACWPRYWTSTGVRHIISVACTRAPHPSKPEGLLRVSLAYGIRCRQPRGK